MPTSRLIDEAVEHVDDLLRIFDGGMTRTGEAYMRAGAGDAADAAEIAAEVAHTVGKGAVGMSATAEDQSGLVATTLGAVGFVLSALLELEQSLPAPPLPFGLGLPALTLADMTIALPHAHGHPPSVVPPTFVPIPFASVGLIVPIPYLSCAMTTTIGSLSAARCGDMGLAFGCFGWFPFYEVLTGSSSVWIEGARAARLFDVSQHCTFSARGPTDPPMGPMLGLPITGSATVLIGGMPMPSLSNYVVGQLMGFAFRGAAALFRRLASRAFVQRLLRSGVLRITRGAPAWEAAIVRDLEVLAQTSTGRAALLRLERAAAVLESRAARGASAAPLVTIVPMPAIREIGESVAIAGEHNAYCAATNGAQSFVHPLTGELGQGSASIVGHSPERWVNHGGPSAQHVAIDAAGSVRMEHIPAPRATTSDAMLVHELTHAANFAEGRGAQMATGGLPYEPGGRIWSDAWTNFEEYAAVAVDNAYRAEVGLPQRADYGALP